MIRMVIADDHPMVREGIKSMLMKHADLEVVGEASNGEEAVGLVRATSPDLLLLDLRMPDMNGPEVTERVLSFAPETKIVILTMYDSDADILPAIEAGANSYLLKDVRPAALAEAIRDTMAGRTVLDSHAVQAVTVQLRRPPSRRQGTLRAGDQSAAAGRRRHDQPADRQKPVHRGDDGKNLFHPHFRQTRGQRSNVGRRTHDGRPSRRYGLRHK